MNNMETLVKALILLISEFSLNGKIKSTVLIKELLEETVEAKRAKTFNDEMDLIANMRNLLTNILDGSIIPNDELYVSIDIMLANRQALAKIVYKYSTKKSEVVIKLLRNELYKLVKKIRVKKLFQTSLNRMLSNNIDVDMALIDIADKITKLKEKKTKRIHPALVDSINFKDEKSVREAAQKAVDLIKGNTVFKTGWSCLDTMTQGGFRRGETVTAGALPHNYKSSFTKSVFLQLCRFNKPIIKDNKKPLMLFVSLEEETDNIMFFFYSYLKFSLENISIKKKDKKKLDPKEVSKYVYDILEATGFHVEVLRMAPDKFDKQAFEEVIESYENDGFEIQSFFLDYAKKMNRRGIDRGGPSGTDLLELFSILRNITSSKSILFFTPHQLNTRAKGLLQNGLPDNEFVQFIAGKGYYADSSQLDQEIDLELFLHLIKKNGKTYLALQRGKHRIPTVIPEEEKYIELMFPNKVSPIPDSSDTHTDICSKVDNEDDDFNF